MRELEELAFILGTVVLLAAHVASSFDLNLAAYAAVIFASAAAISFFACFTEAAALKKPGLSPRALGMIREAYFLFALPAVALAASLFLLAQFAEVKSLLLNKDLVNFLSLAAGCAVGFTAWEAGEGRRFKKKILWKDSLPAEGVSEQLSFTAYALAAGAAAAAGIALLAFVLASRSGLQVGAGFWLAELLGGSVFFSVVAYRFLRSDKTALSERGIGLYDFLHESMEEMAGFGELKEVRLEKAGEKFLAVAVSGKGGRTVFTVHDARGFAEACGKKGVRLIRL